MERGQASLEWIGLVLLVCLACVTSLAAGSMAVDGRPLGAEIARSITCAIRGGCDSGGALAEAYGDDADLVREYAPGLVYEPRTLTLPVDFRSCRSHRCSDAPYREGLDVSRSKRGGQPATVFTHVVRDGREMFIQYWLYYPDSNSTFMGSHRVLRHLPGGDPASHPDDWESVHVRVDADGNARMRASSHKGYQACKQRRCRNRWTDWTPWSRVSYGSHAGHIPVEGRDPRERTTTNLRLIPLETLSTTDRAAAFAVSPPWEKEVYENPRSHSTR